MKNHLRHWGAVYIILALFVGSWVGQAVAQQSEIASQGWSVFWASTLENWQSEFLQLAFQAVVLLGMKHLLFKADAEDEEKLEDKLETIISMLESKGLAAEPAASQSLP